MDNKPQSNNAKVDRPRNDRNVGNQETQQHIQQLMLQGPSLPYGPVVPPRYGPHGVAKATRLEPQVPVQTDLLETHLPWVVRPPLSHTYQNTQQHLLYTSPPQPIPRGVPLVPQTEFFHHGPQTYMTEPYTPIPSYIHQTHHPHLGYPPGIGTAMHLPQNVNQYLPYINPAQPVVEAQTIGKTRARNFETAVVPKKKKSRRICVESGCKKYAQGATKRCVRHGGGRRCQTQDCTKSAAGSTPFCIAHGGGKRCEKSGCRKSAISPANLCFAHGGGKRCRVPGCSKGGRGTASLCIIHTGYKLKTG